MARARATRSKAARLANTEERILAALRRISRAIDLHSRELARTYGLTAPQLVCLRELDRGGALLSGELARAVSLSPATVTGILDRLERRQLVLRERRTEDKRQILVRLTNEGQRFAREAPLPLHERFRRRLARLPAARRRAIEETLRELVEMMEASQIEAAPLLTTGPTTAESSAIESLMHEDGDAVRSPHPRRARRREP